MVEGLSNSWQCGSCLAQETATKKRKSEQQEEEEETGDQMDTAWDTLPLSPLLQHLHFSIQWRHFKAMYTDYHVPLVLLSVKYIHPHVFVFREKCV